MRPLREAATALAILAGTVGGVAAVTMGLVAVVIPASATAVATPTPVPSFDLAVAPTAIGGSLEVTGDRVGTLTLDTATGAGSRYQLIEGGGVSVGPNGDVELGGPDGRIRFDRDDGSITQIDFDGLTFYLDPGECTVTPGAGHPDNGLMVALVECPDIADVRDNGVVSVVGMVAMPVEVLRGRGGLPETGGVLELVSETVDPGEEEITSVSLEEAEIFLDVPPGEEGRINAGSFTADGGVAVQYDPVAERFSLTQVSAGELYAVTSEPCPVTTQDLGRISETVRVVRMEFDCAGWTDVEGDPVTVRGTIVVDVIQGLVDGPAP